jgi:hypothetical protein
VIVHAGEDHGRAGGAPSRALARGEPNRERIALEVLAAKVRELL